MKVTKEIKSFNYKKNIDCFKNYGDPVIDHIYPISLGGNKIKENTIQLTKESNNKKANKTKGKIGKDWRFAVIVKRNKDGKTYGTMYIRNKKWATNIWHKILPAK